MLRISVAACFLLPAGAAVGQSAQPNFEQLFAASQLALQRMSEPGGTEDSVSGPYLEQDAPLQMSQTGINAANVLNSDLDLGSVTQVFDGQQRIQNLIEAHEAGPHGPIAIDQSGSNYANMMRGNTINVADQAITQTAMQEVWNQVWAGGAVDSISQTGVNVANIAMAEYAIGTANQDIAEGAVQRITNHITADPNTVISGKITQSGVNIGNVLIAQRIDSVTRSFAGAQIVENTVVLNGPGVPAIEQSGGNIANMIVANYIGSIKQLSIGEQRVINTVLGPDGQPLSDGNIQQTEYNYQGASNVVNMTVLRAHRNSSSSSDQPVAVDQYADFPQTGQGVSGQSQTGNVTVIER